MDSKIGTYKKTREIIAKHNFKLKKKLGQNFLIDPHVLNKIIKESNIDKNDFVIEIGPGFGSLTEYLSCECKEVTAIEIDKKLIPILKENLKDYKNVEIIHNDILKVDLNDIIKNKDFKQAKVIANLPYYITTPIILNILKNNFSISAITIMVQKEVAKRLNAKPKTKEYGSLSLAVQYYCDTYIVANVPQNCFIPRPDVDSAVIRLTRKENINYNVDENLLFKLIKIAFSKRRKTLLNCIFSSGEYSFNKEEIKNILQFCNIDINIRGEALNLDEFIKISNEIEKRIRCD